MTAPVPPPRRRARHLMDPDAPRRTPSASGNAQAERSLTRVQRTVMSALVLVTISHLSVGLVIAAIFLDLPRRSSQIGLNVIASGFEVVAIAAALAVHRRNPVSPWLLFGLVPGVVGMWLTLR